MLITLNQRGYYGDRKKQEQEVVVMSVKGRMNAVASPKFEKELALLIVKLNNVLISDFVARDYISSAGLRSILMITKKLKEKNGKLLIARLKGMVKEVFKISGFHSIIPIFESVESARSQI